MQAKQRHKTARQDTGDEKKKGKREMEDQGKRVDDATKKNERNEKCHDLTPTHPQTESAKT